MLYHLYGGVRSRAFRVLWALEELGLTCDHTPAAPHSAKIRALNPGGKVPVLVADGVALTDSTAIITFLADRHAGLGFPPGTLERAQQDGLTQMVLDEIDGVLWAISRHSAVLPEAWRVPAVIPSLHHEFALNCARVADRLQGPYLMGEAFTVADIVFGHCLGWARGARIAHDLSALDAYHTRLRARPAYQSARARAA